MDGSMNLEKTVSLISSELSLATSFGRCTHKNVRLSIKSFVGDNVCGEQDSLWQRSCQRGIDLRPISPCLVCFYDIVSLKTMYIPAKSL